MPPAGRPPRSLTILLSAVFVVMIGFGMTVPVLPFYTERITAGEDLSTGAIVFHIGLLTAVYPLMQLLFAPVWGKVSDRIGRRPILLFSVAGYIVSQLLFGIANSLWLLYLARLIGGALTSATVPIASAYIADITDEDDRGRAMARLGAAVSLGAVVGPALGGALSRTSIHSIWSWGHLSLDSFAIPFFAAALLGIVSLAIVWLYLPESLGSRKLMANAQSPSARSRKFLVVLLIGLVSQFALAAFEGTFAVFSQSRLGFGPLEVSVVFIVCGSVMTLFQAVGVGLIARRLSEIRQLPVGLLLMGLGIIGLTLVKGLSGSVAVVVLIASGLSLIAPNVSSLTSKTSRRSQVGAGLGLQNSFNSLGQALGTFVGLALFAIEPLLPFPLTGIVLLGFGVTLFFTPLSTSEAGHQ